MKKRNCRLLFGLFSLVLLLTGIAYFGNRLVYSRIGQPVEKQNEKPGQIYASVPMKNHRQEVISLWWNEDENKYILFLPSFYDEGKRLKLFTVEKEPITLDETSLPSNGSTKAVTQGEHKLQVAGKSYNMEVMCSENIPALFISMDLGKMEDVYRNLKAPVYGAMLKLVSAQGNVENEGNIAEFRVRGNTSADWSKKPYQIKMSRATDFLGMGSAVKWNLLSNWSDKTLLRNKITYDMAKEAGMPFSPESHFTDLYLNGEYQGCYQLCEKIEIGTERVNIRNLEDYTLYEPEKNPPAESSNENGIEYQGYDAQVGTSDISGGYLLEIERPSRIHESISYFVTAHGQPVTVKRPKYAAKSEVRYIAGLWQQMEDGLFTENGVNPGNGKNYQDYIDMDSFVKKYLVEEIVRNYDASSTSQYFYKPADTEDEKIYAGPVWDYDMSLGNPIMSPLTNQHYISSVSPYGLFAALQMDDFSIWYQLYNHPEFREKVQMEYKDVFHGILKELEETGIDTYAKELEPSAILDGVRWGRNKGIGMQGKISEYRNQVEQLKKFVETREYYLSGLWIDGRKSKKVYLDGGQADMYISYVEGLVGDPLEEPLAPVMEGYTFTGWLNGYTKEPYDFSMPYDGSDLYFVAEYKNNSDGSVLIAGE